MSTIEKKWIGPFKIMKLLGSGATGHVFLGEDPSLGRKIALKILKSKFKYDKELRDRFLREARSMAKLSHPSVVSVFAVGDEEGLPYMVMEYLSGSDLLSHIDEEGAMPLQSALSIFIDVAEGLQAAALEKIIHRDVKPANIFLSTDDRAKIGDFGLARALEMDAHLTQDGVIIGTPDYLAPEVIAGEKSTAASDIYSLACSFFHTVVGAPPFRLSNEDVTSGEVLSRHLKLPPPALSTGGAPRALKKLIRQMMHKDPQKRPDYTQVIGQFKNSIRKDTLTINIPRLSTIANNITMSHPSGMDNPEKEDEPLLDFPPALLVAVALFFSAAILVVGVIMLS